MSLDWSKLQSQSIDFLRFPMAVAVVILHYSTTLIVDATGPLKVICIFFQEGVCRLAVPCFFFISGYLFFQQLQKWDWSIWKKKIRRRIRTLLVPYLLWNLIDLIAYWLYSLAHGNDITLIEHFFNVGGLRLFWSINGGIPISVRGIPLDGPLWFIRDLMYFTVFSPLLYWFLTKTKQYGISIFCLVFLCVPGILPEGFIFFLIGAFLQINDNNISKLLWPRRYFLYFFACFFLITLSLFHDSMYLGRLLKNLFLFTGIGAVFCLSANFLLDEKITLLPFLIRSGFFIFSTHEILILRQLAIPISLFLFPESGQIWSCIRFFLTPAITVFICLLLYYVMGVFFPRTTSILTGSRSTQLNHI